MGGPGLRVWVSLFLLAVVGCTPARTQLVVGVDSDLDWGPTATLRGVQITVRSNDPEGQLRDRRTVRLGAATPLPASFGVVPLDGDASRRVWIEVRGCGVDGCETPLVTQQAYVGFVEGQTLLLRMTLARACQPVRCDDPRQVCLPATGSCGSASIDAARLSVWTGSVPATAMDAAVDAYDERAASDLQGAVETGGATDVTVADTTTVDRQALLDTSTEDAVDADVAVVDGHVADILLDAIEPVGDATGDAGVDAAGTRGDAEPAPDLLSTDVGLTDLGASPVDAPVACPSPGQTCSGVCVDVSRDDGNCGGCGVRCATGRACVAGACACMGRAVPCAGGCVDVTTDAANCGACGFRCVAPEHGSTECSASRCVLACNAGFALSGMTCSPIVAPRQLSPLSSATVTSRRSSLRWVLAAGADGARVQVCRDRNCTVVEQQEEVSGSSVTVRELAPGAHFWRLFGRSGASTGTTAGPTWEFFVGQRSAAIEMSWGTVPDFNGDGLGDLVVGAPLSSSSQTGRVYAYYGVRGGLPSALNSGRRPQNRLKS